MDSMAHHAGARATPAMTIGFLAPFAGAAAAAMRAQFGPGVTICVVVALIMSPVWIAHLKTYRFARSILLVGGGALVYGLVLTLSDPLRPVPPSLLLSESLVLLSFLGSFGLLIWARAAIGAPWTVLAFGLGGLANVVIMGGNEVNLWKFALAIPVALTLLGLAMIRGSRVLELVVLVGVAGVSAVSDSRSMTAFLLLAAVLVTWQWVSSGTGRLRPRPWQTLIGLLGLALSAFLLFQALILDGALGEAAAQRTQSQIATSGSLIAGGRPEMGAATALIGAQPWGYGSGVAPTSHDVWIAKSGMNALNYDPNNGYVERYMFGGRFEVHSVLGDLWVRFGPLGAVLILAITALAVYSTSRALSLRTASSALVLLTALGVWDTFFSPLLTSYPTIALMGALAVLPVRAAPLTAPRSP